MILLRGIAILSDLNGIESKLGLQMRGLILGIANRLAELGSELGILDGDGLVDGRVTNNVCRIVRECAQRNAYSLTS